MKKRRIVFLDIDGVMTNFKSEIGSYMTHGTESYGISKQNLQRLLKFCKDTGSEVIISSNWRRFPARGKWLYHGKWYQNPLEDLKIHLGDLFTEVLPIERHITKAEALILWFEENGLEESDIDFVIFDDDPDENLQITSDYGIMNHTVMTQLEFGLTDSDVQKATKILNSNHEKK